MELTSLQKGLFGFKKNSVYEYVSELNRICSEKIDEAKQDKQAALFNLSKKNEELNNQIISLESRIDELDHSIEEKDEIIENLKAQIQSFQNDVDSRKSVENEVSEIIMEARQFASNLKEKAIKENEQLLAKNKQIEDIENLRLVEYSKEISKIKYAINAAIKDSHIKLAKIENDIAALKSETDE